MNFMRNFDRWRHPWAYNYMGCSTKLVAPRRRLTNPTLSLLALLWLIPHVLILKRDGVVVSPMGHWKSSSSDGRQDEHDHPKYPGRCHDQCGGMGYNPEVTGTGWKHPIRSLLIRRSINPTWIPLQGGLPPLERCVTISTTGFKETARIVVTK